jgi:hypothetical protein
VFAGSEPGFGTERSRLASLPEKIEHGSAGVYSDGAEPRVRCEELRKEAAIPIAEDEGMFAVEEVREEVVAAALEGSAEREVFESAVGAGDAVEVGLGRIHGYWLNGSGWRVRSCCARCPSQNRDMGYPDFRKCRDSSVTDFRQVHSSVGGRTFVVAGFVSDEILVSRSYLRNGISRIGDKRARSATARSVSGWMRWWLSSSMSRLMALKELAIARGQTPMWRVIEKTVRVAPETATIAARVLRWRVLRRVVQCAAVRGCGCSQA